MLLCVENHHGIFLNRVNEPYFELISSLRFYFANVKAIPYLVRMTDYVGYSTFGENMMLK